MFLNTQNLSYTIENDRKAHSVQYEIIQKLIAKHSDLQNDYIFFCELNEICKSYSPHANRAILLLNNIMPIRNRIIFQKWRMEGVFRNIAKALGEKLFKMSKIKLKEAYIDDTF